jgi:hypothetical protein
MLSTIDGERCGETLKSIFENAKDPSKVFVGIAEQNEPNDKFCIEMYCQTFGVKAIKREEVRSDVTKIMVQTDGVAESCPHYNQIRQVAFYHVNAKGPMYARSMIRKILGDEEFCMQIDAHSAFAPEWDVVLRNEWKSINNEFAILSTVPPRKGSMESMAPGGKDAHTVPRICKVFFRDNGFPVSTCNGFSMLKYAISSRGKCRVMSDLTLLLLSCRITIRQQMPWQ